MPRVHRPLDHSPEEWREMADRSRQRSLDSFRRCQDDGFMSQAANDLHSDIYRECAKLAENGGKSTFRGLFRRSDGARVRAKLIDGRFGPCWAFCDERGRFTGRFIGDSKGTPRSRLYKEGFEIREELALAAVTIEAGTGGGLCAAFTARHIIIRDDDGYPEDAVVVGKEAA